MSASEPEPDEIKNPKVVVVSAFRDIGRSEWPGVWGGRTTDLYVRWFMNLANNLHNDLVVYVDTDTLHLPKFDRPGITVLDIKGVPNLFSEKYLARESEIMRSKEYLDVIPAWTHGQPQRSFAIYNLVNHDKVAFLRHTQELLPHYDYLVWVDFGGIRDEGSAITSLDPSRMFKNKIVYQGPRDYFPSRRSQAAYNLKSGATWMFGSMFIVPAHMSAWFYEAYDIKLKEFHTLGIVDTDQSVVYQVRCDYPDSFKVIRDDEWFMLLRRYFHWDSIEWDLGDDDANVVIPKSTDDDAVGGIVPQDIDRDVERLILLKEYLQRMSEQQQSARADTRVLGPNNNHTDYGEWGMLLQILQRLGEVDAQGAVPSNITHRH